MIVASTGAQIAECVIDTDPEGYRRLIEWADIHAPNQRVWAVEGCGSYGAGLARYLIDADQWVAEAERPARPARRHPAKNDRVDAVRAARETLARDIDEVAVPRCGTTRDALAALVSARDAAVAEARRAASQLAAAVVTAPDGLRARFDPLSTSERIDAGCALGPNRHRDPHTAASARAIQSIARRARTAHREADQLRAEINDIVMSWRPDLVELFGVGPITAAVILCAWSHPGRVRSEAAFASISGTAPIEASSGQTRRHRLNPRGDRRLNAALHTIVLARWRHCPETATYITKRRTQGKTDREIRRCLKRAIARRLWRHLQHPLDET